MGWLVWDPSPVFWVIPFINKPIVWYGALFAFGFFCAYRLGGFLERDVDFPKRQQKVVDALFTYVFIGTIVGARLGHLFFYHRLSEIQSDPLIVFRIWEGGLASHGAAVGIIVSLLIFSLKEGIRFLSVVDLIVIPTALCGIFIRTGNFINQEIIGKESTLPWAVIFKHPIDGSAVLPRHPVQLYEAALYALIALGLYTLWKWKKMYRMQGMTTALFFITVFGGRFALEFYKAPLSPMDNGSLLTTGQFLSIPCIVFGVLVLFRKREEWQKLLRK